jgi:hypothetical protein
MTGVNAADDATILLACNQVKTRINLTTPAQSGVFLAPAPGNTNHPIQLPAATHTTFMNTLTIWINAEKTAP